MGSITAMDLAESATSKMKLRIAIEQHLRYNHFPPVPYSMVDPCLRAIEYGNKRDWDHKIRLPDGVTWRGKKLAPVSAMIEAHHLDFFLEDDGEEFY